MATKNNTIAATKTHSPQVDHQFAGQYTGIEPKADLARQFQPLAALPPHGLQNPHPPFVARAPGLDALANPRFFFRQLLVEVNRRARLDLQQFLFFTQVSVEVAGKSTQLSPIELDDSGRQML